MAKNGTFPVEYNQNVNFKGVVKLDKSLIFRKLQEADWESIGKELLGFALWWADRYRWRSGSPSILAKGNELQDIVQDIILQTISGERKWDPEKGELLPWLRDQAKSVIDALAKSASHRREVNFFDDDENCLTDREEYQALQADPLENQNRLTPEEVLMEKESNEEMSETINIKYTALFNAIGGDEELEEVLDVVIKGCELKPRFLARELNVSVENINNRLKRLRRKAMSLKVQK